MNNIIRSVIKTNASKYIAVFCISTLICLLLCGAFSAAFGLECNVDHYLYTNGMYDLYLRSEVGFSEDDIEELTQNSGGSVSALFSTDCTADVGGKQPLVRVYSIDDAAPALILTEGRMPMSDKECVANAATFKLNSTVKLSLDEQQPSLNNGELRVVGLFESPMYLTNDYGKSGDKPIDGVLYVKKSNFKLTAYTDVFIAFETLADDNCFGANYKSGIKSVLARVEFINVKRVKALYGQQMTNLEYTLAENASLIEQYNAEIKFYEDSIKAYEDKLDDLEPEMKKLRKYLDNYADIVGISSEDVIVFVESYMQTLDTLSVQIKEIEEQFVSGYSAYNEQYYQYANKAGDVTNDYNNELIKINSSDMDDDKKAAEIKKLDEKHAKKSKELKAEKEALDKEYDRLAKLSSDLDSLKQSYNNILAELRSNDINADSDTINIENYYKLELSYLSMKSEYDMLKSSRDYLQESSAVEIEVINSNIAAALAENEEQQRLLDEYKSNYWTIYQRTDSKGYADYDALVGGIRSATWSYLPYAAAAAAMLILVVLLLAVRGDSRRIGVLRMLGLSSSRVMVVYAGFAASAAALGGLLGIALGCTVVPLVSVMLTRSSFNLPSVALGLDYIAVAVVFAAVVLTAALLCGLLALLCARKRPAELIARPVVTNDEQQ